MTSAIAPLTFELHYDVGIIARVDSEHVTFEGDTWTLPPLPEEFAGYVLVEMWGVFEGGRRRRLWAAAEIARPS